MTNYEAAREKYAALGVDTDKAIETLKKVPVSLHCWQLDDVIGFDNDGGLTGGIQTTGNYMGRARTPEQLMADMEEAMRLMPGTTKLNIHASYAIFAPGEFADRDALEPKHFAKWVEFAKKHHMGIDFNPTFFSHEKVKDGQTLSSPDEETRRFWINHGKACIRISEYFAKETGMPCVMNIWTGDGFKDVPADRMGPRMRYKNSIEQILSEPYDHNLVKPCVESKVFGIGVESYTVGSAEFTLSFAALHDGCMPLMDNGHYHPLEYVSDKIPAMLCFYPEFALHITRGVRWDSDHVLILDDETKEMAKEIVRDNALDRVYMALDYFDASINRVSALATGFRSWQKALLIALCTPNAMLKALQDTNQMSKLMVMNEAVKMLPIGEIWDEYLRREGVVDDLHFYDENSMLGLGMENDKYLKLEMYNVSNGKAKQISKKVLKRYMDSDALYDYKSIIVDKEKNLIGFNATLSNGNYDDVYVLYRFENNKFKKLAEVSLSGESCAVRGLYIDNYFYIVTLGKDVKVLDLNNYKVVKKLK